MSAGNLGTGNAAGSPCPPPQVITIVQATGGSLSSAGSSSGGTSAMPSQVGVVAQATVDALGSAAGNGGGGGASSVQSMSTGGASSTSLTTAGGTGGGAPQFATAGTAGSSTSNGGSISTGGMNSTGGTTAVNCVPGTTDLMALAVRIDDATWIGADAARGTDAPCGFRGRFRAFSDEGADSNATTQGDNSLWVPALKAGSVSEYEDPCINGKCCISGKTSLWPVLGSTTQYTTWGARLSFSFSETNDGARFGYSGNVQGFLIGLSGELNGQSVRIGYSQTVEMANATDGDAGPFMAVSTLGDKAVYFSDPTCPSWSKTCIDPGLTPFGLEIIVAGGDKGTVGDFELCITKLIPIRS